MKKICALILTIISFAAIAGVQAPFRQFAASDYIFNDKPTQTNWEYSDMFSLKVPGGSDVWLTNITTTWYGTNPDLSTIFDMSSDGYGYYKVVDGIKTELVEKSQYAEKGLTPVYGNGTTTKVTFYDDTLPTRTVTANAYLLGYFPEDTEIFLAMTPLDTEASELVDSYQFVNDPAHESTFLQSRQFTASGQLDFVGNIRVNFGTLSNPSGNEFTVIFGEHVPTAGQPLPGALISSVLMLGTIVAGKKMKSSR